MQLLNSESPHDNLIYRMEEKPGGKKLWRIPQSEFWQTKSLANYATCYHADVITLKVGEKNFGKFLLIHLSFYRQVFLLYGNKQTIQNSPL